MIPPSSPAPVSFGEYWNDEQIFKSLYKFIEGSPLPEGVYPDSIINPYRWDPSNLPDGIWYFVCSTERKQTELGFWRARGEACEIYRDSHMSGLRNTLEYFEGPAPLGRRTDWLMQEYKITRKGLCDENELEGSRTLCRVFLCDGEGPSSKTLTKNNDIIDTDVANSSRSVSTVPSTESTSRREIRHATLITNTESPAGERLPELGSVTSVEPDYFLNGDYLELDDLADQESRASSSDISSCESGISDEIFDSLLRDIEDEIEKDRETKGLSSKFSMAAALAIPDLLVLQPPAVATAIGSKSPPEKSGQRSATNADTGKQKVERRHDGSSSSEHEASSSNSQIANSKGKWASRSKKKLKKQYLCFLPF